MTVARPVMTSPNAIVIVITSCDIFFIKFPNSFLGDRPQVL